MTVKKRTNPNPTTTTTTTTLQPTYRLTTTTANKILTAALQKAKANGWTNVLTIAIVDAGGVPILVSRGDDAMAASYEIAVGKAKTAALFRKNTSDLESSTNVVDGSSRTALLSTPFLLMGGGVPIFVHDDDDVCIGGVGVSGLKPEQDEEISTVGIRGWQETEMDLDEIWGRTPLHSSL